MISDLRLSQKWFSSFTDQHRFRILLLFEGLYRNSHSFQPTSHVGSILETSLPHVIFLAISVRHARIARTQKQYNHSLTRVTNHTQVFQESTNFLAYVPQQLFFLGGRTCLFKSNASNLHLHRIFIPKLSGLLVKTTFASCSTSSSGQSQLISKSRF